METKLNETNELESRFLFLVNNCFLFIHVGFLFIFADLGVYFMTIFNIGSILFYLLVSTLIRKNRYRLFVWLSGIEVLAHMSAATICVGLGGNFQLSLLGMLLFFFITECFIQNKHRNTISLLSIDILYSIALIALYSICYRMEPVYVLSEKTLHILSMGVLVFVLLIILLSMIFLSYYIYAEEEKLTKKAEYDALTGLPNRFYMMDELTKVFQSGTQAQYYVAMIDIDNFKTINDTYGHNIGDDALKVLARTIIENARENGLKYCRWGGEEFLLLGKCEKDGSIPKEKLDGLRVAIASNTIRTPRSSFHYTVTIGAGKYQNGQSSKEWIDFVDKQLYVGKCTGKNKVVC